MRQLNLEKMNGDWESLPKSECSEKGYFPNKILWRVETKHLVIEVARAIKGDFALSEKALDAAASKTEWQCYVRLVETDGTYVNSETVKNIKLAVKYTHPLNGQYGPYWWLTDDFKLASLKKVSDSCPI
jgi:hypothetical protein